MNDRYREHLEFRARQLELDAQALKARNGEGGGFYQARDAQAIRAVLEENERLRAALTRMAKDGCGLTTLPENKPCSDQWPDDDEQWCWSCQAIKALNGGEA